MLIENSKIKKKRVSILGCGWLGLPLAQRLAADDILFNIKGSNTSLRKMKLLKTFNIDGYLIEASPELVLNEPKTAIFFESDLLILSIPPKRTLHDDGYYSKTMLAVADTVKKSPIQEVILLSSTGVYPNLNTIAFEADVWSPEQSPLPDMVQAENYIKNLGPLKTVTILRLAGLLGYNRIPGKYVKGKVDLTSGSTPVNYIHRDDAVNIICNLVKKGIKNDTYNVVAPQHPIRREIYIKNCNEFNWTLPTFKEPLTPEPFKIISGEKLESYLSPEFVYPNPLDFYYED